MVLSRELDCRLAILRVLIEALDGVVDKNLSRFNQLVHNRCFEWAVGLAVSTDIPLTPALSQGERGMFTARRGLRVGTVLIPLQGAESSSMGQERRQG